MKELNGEEGRRLSGTQGLISESKLVVADESPCSKYGLK